ncbi:magnesium transporter [Tateyamaria pelophila]|uniref:magnesium transporter n=1 Tax=Tateyamaria pelophila TaxID=328415 RepID=UPI001CBD0A9E|nr:magnesium transporter [Tateyamaria pelophila]
MNDITLDMEAVRDTAAEHMLTGIPRAHVDTPVDQVIDTLRGSVFECADTVFVTDAAGKLLGLVRINDLFADGRLKIGDIMKSEHESVRLDADQEQIAALAMRLKMIAVPVVDRNERLIGAVPPEALFRILREEHMEDLQVIAGITAHDDGPGAALDASILNRLSRRLPWLIFGLVASSVITVVMVQFEHALSANVAVAFFVPALVYIAGAIGSQAVSVSVRSLAADSVQILPLLRDELIIGVGIGAALGVLASFGVLAVFGDQLLATAVGLAVLSGGTMSAVVGFGLPWVFQKLGSDPAMGSGPICTIIQDVASLFIYFGLVSLLVL